MADDNKKKKPGLTDPADPAKKPAASGRPLPHAAEAEKSVLSSMMQDPLDYVGRAVEEKLRPAHFHNPAHQTLCKILYEFNEANNPVDLITLTQVLDDRGLLDNLGGAAGLTAIHTYQSTAAHFDYHLQMVRDKSVLRSIISSSTEAITRAYDDPGDVAACLDKTEASILRIRDDNDGGKEETITEAMEAVMDLFQRRLAGELDQLGLPTGYHHLDRITQGLKPGEMFIIAARPSMGKTSLMMNIVEHVTIEEGVPSLVFSCEMTTHQLVERLFFSRSRFPSQNLSEGKKPTKPELARMMRAKEEIAQSKLFIDPTPSISINEVRAKARRKKREENIGLVAVDYLQLMRAESLKAETSRQQEVSEISAGLKALAKELDVPVLVLAQLNRSPETRGGSHKPRMSDLRESGSIEQDADIVGLLYRDAYYSQDDEDKDDKEGLSELIIDKNRNGPTESVKLTFLDKIMRFETRAFPSQKEPQ